MGDPNERPMKRCTHTVWPPDTETPAYLCPNPVPCADHPPTMPTDPNARPSFLRNEHNRFGTPVSRHRCLTCGGEFTVCPQVPPEKHDQWDGCLAETCDSYDITRDADLFWDAMTENGLISREGAE